MPSTSAPRAPGSESVVASGDGGTPAARRAAATSRAVRTAVPDGASTLLGWCSSTTSTEGKNRAASCAKRMSSTAPMPKFGAMITPRSGFGSSHSATVASFPSSKPVVPTTQWMSLSMQNRMLSMTTSGRVKSTTTWAPASATLNSHSPASTMATSSRSSAALTALTTSVPIRPRAPSTPTLMRGGSPVVEELSCWPGTEVVTRSSFPRPRPGATQRSAGGPAPRDQIPEQQPQDDADHVGHPVPHGRVAFQGRDALQQLADRRVQRQQPGEHTACDAGPATGQREGGEQRAVHQLVSAGRRGGHVCPRGEQHGERHEHGDREDTPRERAVDLERTGHGLQAVEVGLAVGPDDGKAHLAGEQIGADRPHLLLVDGVQASELLALREVLPVGQLALAEPAHPRSRVLQAQHQAALELAATAGNLLGGEPLLGDPRQFLAHQPQHLGHPLGGAAGIPVERPGARVVGERRADAVDQAPLLADLLEQPRA